MKNKAGIEILKFGVGGVFFIYDSNSTVNSISKYYYNNDNFTYNSRYINNKPYGIEMFKRSNDYEKK